MTLHERRGSLVKSYSNYLFDLYGTLVDIHTDEEKDELWFKMSVLLSMDGIHIPPKQLRTRYLKTVSLLEKTAQLERGTGAEIDIAEVFASWYDCASTDARVARAAKTFRLLSLEKLKLFPGVIKLLENLKCNGKKIYLLSNAQELFTMPELRVLGLEEYFDGILISSIEGHKKPDRRFYDLVLSRYHLHPEETVMVGNDDQADCWGAAKAGLDSMYICTEQSPKRTTPLPPNCIVLKRISQVY